MEFTNRGCWQFVTEVGEAVVLVSSAMIRRALLQQIEELEHHTPCRKAEGFIFFVDWWRRTVKCLPSYYGTRDSGPEDTGLFSRQAEWDKATWNCARLCVALLAYYRILSITAPRGLPSTLGFSVLSPDQLYGFPQSRLCGNSGSSLRRLSYREMRQCIEALPDVALIRGAWFNCLSVTEDAQARIREFVLPQRSVESHFSRREGEEQRDDEMGGTRPVDNCYYLL
jgi:hypothetical protein